MLDHFSWGSAFFEVNRELLDIYAACTDAADIGEKQEAWMTKLEQEYQDRRAEDTTTDDMWATGNANHTAADVESDQGNESVPENNDEDENDEDLWTTDRLGNRVRKD